MIFEVPPKDDILWFCFEMGLAFLGPVLEWQADSPWPWPVKCLCFVYAPVRLFPINILALSDQRAGVPNGGRGGPKRHPSTPSHPHSRPRQLFLPMCVNGPSYFSFGTTVQTQMRGAGEGEAGNKLFYTPRECNLVCLLIGVILPV